MSTKQHSHHGEGHAKTASKQQAPPGDGEKEALMRSKEYMMKNLQVNDQFLHELVSRDILNMREVNWIKAHDSNDDKVSTFLQILMQRTPVPSHYYRLLEIFDRTNQGPVRKELENERQKVLQERKTKPDDDNPSDSSGTYSTPRDNPKSSHNPQSGNNPKSGNNPTYSQYPDTPGNSSNSGDYQNSGGNYQNSNNYSNYGNNPNSGGGQNPYSGIYYPNSGDSSYTSGNPYTSSSTYPSSGNNYSQLSDKQQKYSKNDDQVDSNPLSSRMDDLSLRLDGLQNDVDGLGSSGGDTGRRLDQLEGRVLYLETYRYGSKPPASDGYSSPRK